MLTTPAAPGSVQSCWPENPARATNHKSAALLVTVREVVPFKVAVSDVEENSVMTRVWITVARTGCVTSAAAIAIAKDTSVEGLKILNEGFVFMGLIGCCFTPKPALLPRSLVIFPQHAPSRCSTSQHIRCHPTNHCYNTLSISRLQHIVL